MEFTVERLLFMDLGGLGPGLHIVLLLLIVKVAHNNARKSSDDDDFEISKYVFPYHEEKEETTEVLWTGIQVVNEPCNPTGVLFRKGIEQCNQGIAYLNYRPYYENFLEKPSVRTLNATCRIYRRWLRCLKSLTRKCNVTIEETEQNIEVPRKLIKNTCVTKYNDLTRNLGCFISQARDANPLYRGCFALMSIRSQAGIFDKCSMAIEYIKCEDRLLRSACGSAVADFSLALSMESKLYMYSKSDTCLYKPLPSQRVFEYSINCPPDFPVKMKVCYRNFLRTKVILYTKMLAVVKATSEQINLWCSAFREYEECVAPIVRDCPNGVKEVYKTATEWHRLVKVAKYLCGEPLEEYKYYLPCYERVVRYTSHVSLCRRIFDHYPTSWQAYSIKCTPNVPHHKKQLEKRERLIDCFNAFFESDCGLNGSAILAPLIRMQYSFDFLPPCSVHDEPNCPCKHLRISAAQYKTFDTNLLLLTLLLSYICINPVLWLSVKHNDNCHSLL